MYSSLETESKHSDQITLAVASSLTVPIKKISVAFEERYEVKVELVMASSGVLTAQIINGAPFDLFLSANLQYPQNLFERGKTFSEPQIFALGSLAFWSKTPLSGGSPQSILQQDHLQAVAIANPTLAPFGDAAKQWLKENTLYQHIKKKLVFGENVSQVNQFIFSDKVSAAFTSASVMYMPQLSGKGHWKALSSSNALDIPHGAVTIQQTDTNTQNHKIRRAELFMDYLFSKEAQRIFQQFGYRSPHKKR